MSGGASRLVAFALALGCASNADAIARGQRYYEDNQYERALAIWRDLERRDPGLSPRERTRYAYLRGMTDYRLGYRNDARHWLAVAKANRERAPDALVPSWTDRLDAALADLEGGGRANPSGDVVQTIAAPSAAPDSSSTEPVPSAAALPSTTLGTDAGAASSTAPVCPERMRRVQPRE